MPFETQLKLFCGSSVYTAVPNVILIMMFYTRQYSKPFRCIISINLFHTSLRLMLLIFLFYRWGHGGPEMLSILHKVSVIRQQNQALSTEYWLQSLYFKPGCCSASNFGATLFSRSQQIFFHTRPNSKYRRLYSFCHYSIKVIDKP